jgi:hypothetical protein
MSTPLSRERLAALRIGSKRSNGYYYYFVKTYSRRQLRASRVDNEAAIICRTNNSIILITMILFSLSATCAVYLLHARAENFSARAKAPPARQAGAPFKAKLLGETG